MSLLVSQLQLCCQFFSGLSYIGGPCWQTGLHGNPLLLLFPPCGGGGGSLCKGGSCSLPPQVFSYTNFSPLCCQPDQFTSNSKQSGRGNGGLFEVSNQGLYLMNLGLLGCSINSVVTDLQINGFHEKSVNVPMPWKQGS